ncbi:uncharacterized protein LOC26526502 [Drosophila erecta]|uniref:TIL domain-containing protein n=1 Tax=Drosophila erecta TaxID=7220 RepID=A0A0Q5T3V3_DROER|nr:uncharacterized protein LOC26526502 [Drosophila erecta]KQS30044.1 uncharacterized protein Dere_GG26678 [Drosophila erecta]
MQNRWTAVKFLLLLMVPAIRGNLDGSGRCGPYECHLSNPICRCESFCQEFTHRCWKNPSGCHCARGYARDEGGHCVPLILCA